MRATVAVAVLVVVAGAAGCSSSSSSKPLALPLPAHTTSTVPKIDPAQVASCSQFDDGMSVAYQDITKMQTGHIDVAVMFLADDMHISRDKVKAAAADAPVVLAGHESDVAKSLDTLTVKINGYHSGTLDVAAEMAAVHSAEDQVRQDCQAAGYSLKNMVAG